MERNWKFGARQYGSETPKGISLVINVWSAVATVIMGWMPTAPFISHRVQDVLTPLLALTIGIAQSIKPFFGKTDADTKPYSAPKDDEISKP